MSIQAVLSIVLSLFFFTTTRAQKTIAAYSTLPKEHNCMQYFDNTAQGYAPINVFLMAKFSELIYPERLDYNIRYNQNAQSKVDSIPSTQWISDNLRINDDNFESFFEGRFRHYFGSEKGTVAFKYLHKTHIEPSRFLGFKTKGALDPELMLISTPTQIFIIFRGTDRAGKHEWAEWFGTDFKIAMTKAGGALVGTNIHTGFWRSFDLIRDDLMAQLSLFDAKNKKVFLTGHSLGGAMAIIAGAYLKASNFDVQNIYAYAAPITLGGFKFKKKLQQLLPKQIQRIEYATDPISIMWAPGFPYKNVGNRHWIDTPKGYYKCYPNTKERTVFLKRLKKYPMIQASSKRAARQIKRRQFRSMIAPSMHDMQYHNPPYYTMACYEQLSEEEQRQLPDAESPFPYLFYGTKGSK